MPFHDDKPNALEELICKGDLNFSNPLWLDVHEAGRTISLVCTLDMNLSLLLIMTIYSTLLCDDVYYREAVDL